MKFKMEVVDIDSSSGKGDFDLVDRLIGTVTVPAGLSENQAQAVTVNTITGTRSNEPTQ